VEERLGAFGAAGMRFEEEHLVLHLGASSSGRPRWPLTSGPLKHQKDSSTKNNKENLGEGLSAKEVGTTWMDDDQLSVLMGSSGWRIVHSAVESGQGALWDSGADGRLHEERECTGSKTLTLTCIKCRDWRSCCTLAGRGQPWVPAALVPCSPAAMLVPSMASRW